MRQRRCCEKENGNGDGGDEGGVSAGGVIVAGSRFEAHLLAHGLPLPLLSCGGPREPGGEACVTMRAMAGQYSGLEAGSREEGYRSLQARERY
jgi:hypothetical protein